MYKLGKRTLFITVLLACIVTSASSWALTVVASQSEIQSFLGGEGGVLIFTDDADGGKLKYIDLNDAALTVHTLDSAACRDPRLSLDGTRVVYGVGGLLYARSLSGGDRVQIADVGTARSSGVGYWYREGGADYIVYATSTEKYGYETGETRKQRIRDGIQLDGSSTLIYDKAYDGGITPDGVWIGEAYGDRHAYNLDTSSEYASFYKSDGSLEGQCCNGSMAPQTGTYRMTTLVLPHSYFRTWEFDAGQDRWEEYRTYTNPGGTVEWQRPEWSLHPDFITVVADDGGYDLYIQHVHQTGTRIKVVDGNIGNSHLYVGSTTPVDPPVSIDSFSADPGTVVEGDSTTLSWATSNATAVSIDQGVGSVSDDGSTSITPTSTTTYTLTAEGEGGPSTRQVTVTVTGPPALDRLAISPTSAFLQPGQTQEFTARATDQLGDAFAVAISWSATGGAVSPASSDGATALHSTAYTSDGSEGAYTVTASAGGLSAEATLTVATAPPLHLLVNCGDNSHDVSGWERDDAFVSGGEDWSNDQAVSTMGVADAAPAAVYRSVRHVGSGYPRFNLPVPDGVYTLRLHFADKYDGRDIFVDVEGERVLHEYDIAPDAGGSNLAAVKRAAVSVVDGDGVTVELGSGGGGDAFVAGIELIAGDFVDGEAPQVNIAAPGDGSTQDGLFTLSGVAHDNGAVERVEVSLDGGAWQRAYGTSAWSLELDASGLSAAAHELRVRATDRQGNSTIATLGVVGTAPVADAGASPDAASVGDAANGDDAAVSEIDAGGADDAAVSAPGITITSPTGGDVWEVGSTQLIRWSTVGIDDVAIRFSTDGGQTFEEITPSIYEGQPDWGALPWVVPDQPSDSCVIFIVGYFGEAPTQSQLFEIGAPGSAADAGGGPVGVDAGSGSEQAAGEQAGEGATLGDGLACAGAAPGVSAWPTLGSALLFLFARRRRRR